MNKQFREELSAQIIDEISTARIYKQSKVNDWQKNEELYYGKKRETEDARSNVGLSRTQEFVHTLLSKIDNPLVFNFIKRKNSQRQRVERLNALRRVDSDRDTWDIKDIVGKKQAIIYGRAIYNYYASSEDKEYRPHLEPIDVYNFLIDPDCGGIDIEEASYMGDYSVTLEAKQMKEGNYIKEEVKNIIQDQGVSQESSTEELNKQDRERLQDTGTKDSGDTRDAYKFWRWYTTYKSERYYALIDNNGRIIKLEKLTDIFPATKEYPRGAYPYWTWACFLDLTEFWTPSYCDYAREIFMAEDVTINQMLDNSEQINKPQRIVDVSKIEDESELTYTKNGHIRVKGDVGRAYMTLDTPAINTPAKVYEILEQIQQKSSGVTDVATGVSDERGKVGIYEGNKEAEMDRFGLLNKSYGYGYNRFARLYEAGVRRHLIKSVAVDLYGNEGVEVSEIKNTDIFKKEEDFNVLIEASNAEMMENTRDKNTKILFLQNQINNRSVNQKKIFEMQAEIIGLKNEEIRELLDVDIFGSIELMSECDIDIEALLDNKDIKPNKKANNAYKQKMVDYLKEHSDDIDTETFARFAQYIKSIEAILIRNERRKLDEEIMNRRKQELLQKRENELSPKQEGQEKIKLEEGEL